MIAASLAAALRRPDRLSRVAYLCGGYPSPEAFPEVLRRVSAVADAVEVGVPFADPVADGPVLRDAHHAALRGGATLAQVLRAIAEVRPGVPVVLMGYLDPFVARGFDRLAEDCAAAGVSAVIAADLPFDESDWLRAPLHARGVGLVGLVAPNTPPARQRAIAARSDGFAYAVARLGTTGGGTDASAARAGLAALRAVSPVPVCAGFGFASAAQVATLRRAVDGVVIGTALAAALARGEDPAALLSTLVLPLECP